MNKKTRTALVVVILVVTIGFVAWQVLDTFGNTYISVDEVAENPDGYMGRTIQLKGNYQNGSLLTTTNNVTLIMEGENNTITVLILGETPNLIDGQEIVAIGQLQSANLIHATEILTACPSKYEVTTTTP
jgi:cytochrome c-type biogenesis protein CcmE